jgi:catechol 2,3-dioxygenase-like lactoylglutathione lyase family enzyme
MPTRIDVITIAVADLAHARRFYEQGFGARLRESSDGTLTLSFGANASTFALRAWDALAADAGVAGESSGFRGFTLSYIVDTADGVDDMLARLERHGGVISKPPKGAVWGYSAYVTDPAGHLWKIASSKRKPLLKRGSSADGLAEAVPAKEVPITIGVADMARAKTFYKDGLGLPVKKDYRKFVMFDGGERASGMGMYKREALADDAAVAADGSGFPGFSLTHVVDSRAQVDAALDQAVQAGGQLVRPASNGGGEYGGYFADPDGILWKVAASA